MERVNEFPLLETQRLKLRAMVAQDAEGYAELLSDESTYPYITESGPIGALQIPARISRNNEFFVQGRAIYWTLDRVGTFIGYVALHGPAEPIPALSYAIRKEWRRQGFAAEALDAVCEYAFSRLGCREVAAHSHLDNEASAALLVERGFRNTGVVGAAAGRRNEFRRAAV